MGLRATHTTLFWKIKTNRQCCISRPFKYLTKITPRVNCSVFLVHRAERELISDWFIIRSLMVMYEKFSEKIQSMTKTNFSLTVIIKLLMNQSEMSALPVGYCSVTFHGWFPLYVSRHESLKNFSLTETFKTKSQIIRQLYKTTTTQLSCMTHKQIDF